MEPVFYSVREDKVCIGEAVGESYASLNNMNPNWKQEKKSMDDNKLGLVAKIGIGAVIGVASAFLLREVSRDVTILKNRRDIRNLQRENTDIRQRLKALEISIQESKNATSVRSLGSSRSGYFTPDEDSDTFYDLDSDKESNGESPVFSNFLTKVDKLIDGSEEEQIEAYFMLQSKNIYNIEVEYMWRLSKAKKNMSVIHFLKKNHEKRKEYILDAYKDAETALSMKKCAETHKWYAILIGLKGEISSLNERVKCGKIFIEHIDIAIKLNQYDPTLNYLKGVFCYRVSQLSWVERKAAAALFGEVPTSTYEEAIKHLMIAHELYKKMRKPSIQNYYYIYKCQYVLKNHSSAMEWLEQAAAIPVNSPEDLEVAKEVKAIISK